MVKSNKKVKVANMQQPKKKRAVDSNGAARVAKPSAGLGPGASMYLEALTRPFSERAIGARVPDLYSAPTSTAHIRKLYTLSSDVSGNLAGFILPSPFIHMFTSTGTISGGGSGSWIGWTGNVAGNQANTDPTDTKSKLSNARIVSYGVRIKNTQSMTNVSGRFTVARLPLKDDAILPYLSAVGGSTSTDASFTREAWYSNVGIPYTGSGDGAAPNGAAMTALPENVTVTSMQLAETGLDVVPKVITPYAFGLRNTSDSAAGNDTSPGVATGSIYAGDDDYLKFGGFESVLFIATGLPANLPCITIELIYHLEGTPNISSAANGGLIFDTPMKSRMDISGFNKALEMAATAASFVTPGLMSNVARIANKVFN